MQAQVNVTSQSVSWQAYFSQGGQIAAAGRNGAYESTPTETRSVVHYASKTCVSEYVFVEGFLGLMNIPIILLFVKYNSDNSCRPPKLFGMGPAIKRIQYNSEIIAAG